MTLQEDLLVDLSKDVKQLIYDMGVVKSRLSHSEKLKSTLLNSSIPFVLSLGTYFLLGVIL